MEFRYDAVSFIFKKGDPFTKLCVLEMVGLEKTSPGKKLLLDILRTQKKDGGFPSKIDESLSGVKETERIASLLLRCGWPKDGLSLTGCMRFLLKNQTEEGGFRESPKLNIPEEVVELSNRKAVTWLTADLIDLLRQMGQEHTKACQKAINWLRRMETPQGSWGLFEEDQGVDPDSSAQITFLMQKLLGKEDPLYKRGSVLFEKHLDQMAQNAQAGFYYLKGEKRQNDIYHLTHLLGQSMFSGKRGADAGYNIGDERVKKSCRE